MFYKNVKIEDIKKKCIKKFKYSKIKNSNKVKEKGIELKKEKESERNKEAYKNVEKPNMRVKLKNLLFYKVLIWFRLPKEKVN